MVRVLVVLLAACGSSQRAPLAKAGDDKDDGAGELARASLQLTTPAGEPGTFNEARAKPRDYGYGGDSYGGASYGYGGDPYGGIGYANWRVPQWTYAAPNRMPRYNVSLGL